MMIELTYVFSPIVLREGDVLCDVMNDIRGHDVEEEKTL